MSETSSFGRFNPFKASESIQHEGDGILLCDAESEISDNDGLSFAVLIVDGVGIYFTFNLRFEFVQ